MAVFDDLVPDAPRSRLVAHQSNGRVVFQSDGLPLTHVGGAQPPALRGVQRIYASIARPESSALECGPTTHYHASLTRHRKILFLAAGAQPHGDRVRQPAYHSNRTATHHVDVPGRVRGEIVRPMELGLGSRSAITRQTALTRAGYGGDDSRRIDAADTVVFVVGHIDVAGRVCGYATRRVELGRGGRSAVTREAALTRAGYGGDDSRWIDAEYVYGVCDIDVAGRVRGHVERVGPANGGDDSRRIDPKYASGQVIRNIDVASCVRGHSVRSARS